jgi:hypothetical protein
VKDFRLISDTLASALKRVDQYVNYLPPTVARDVREAIKQYEMAVARAEIVQQPGVKPYCSHQYARENGKCLGCGELV